MKGCKDCEGWSDDPNTHNPLCRTYNNAPDPMTLAMEWQAAITLRRMFCAVGRSDLARDLGRSWRESGRREPLDRNWEAR